MNHFGPVSGVMTVAVPYHTALASSCQVDAAKSKLSNIVSDILAIMVPDQKIYITIIVKHLQPVSAEGEVTTGI